MRDRKITIDGLDIPFSGARPSEYVGIHSGVELCAWDLEVTLYGPDNISHMENLLNMDTVTVEDGFAGRQYEATVAVRLTSSQSGRQGKFYQFEVREVDLVRAFEELEIEGQLFQVIKNTETFHDDVIRIHVLLAPVFRRVHPVSQISKTWPNPDSSNRD